MIVVVILPFVREKVTCFTSPDRLLIFGVVSGSVNAGGTTSSLFFTWCPSPRPSVGVVLSRVFARFSALRQGLSAFLPGCAWVFCAGVGSPGLPCTITVFCLGVVSPPGIL